MKKIVTCLYIVAAYFTTNAQITIDQSDMPIAGDSTIRVNATNGASFTFPTTGANYTWDFSTLTYNNQTTNKYFDITKAPLLGLLTFGPFASNNLKSQIFMSGASPLNLGVAGNLFASDSNYEYYKKTASRYARTGYTLRLNGIDVPLPYDSNEVMYMLPVNYGNVDSGISVFEIDISLLPIYYKTRQKRVNNVDGWGTLKLPNGYDYQTLRVKSEIYAIDSVHVDTLFPFGFSTPRPKTVEYKWLAKGLQAPVLEVSGTELGGNFTATSVKYLNKVALPICTNSASFTDFSIFPTRSTTNIYVQSKFELKEIIIIDMHGNIVKSIKNKPISYYQNVDIASLPTGYYNLKALLVNGKTENAKFIKE